MSQIELPSTKPATLPQNHQPYEYCRNVFIDLGTNIGDSIGYFVDNSFDVCTPTWMKTHPEQRLHEKFPRIRLDVSDLTIRHEGASGRNPLNGVLQQQLQNEEYGSVGPETFCVYGMEGNPVFTERLQKLENFVMNMHPRPVRHLHIHTESVISAVDGPTKLFLDKTSVAGNVSPIPPDDVCQFSSFNNKKNAVVMKLLVPLTSYIADSNAHCTKMFLPHQPLSFFLCCCC